jgi:GNAT superfamily N-acetyltransferase
MGDLHIRRARPADLEVLVRELGQREFFEDRLSRQHDSLGMLLIAWLDDRPIGVLYLWLEDAEEAELRAHLPPTPILNHLEVRPGHRGAGTGTKLIEAAERRLRMLGFGRVALAVEENNSDAARLYERLHYEEWPHAKVQCLTLSDSNGQRAVEICRIMVKTLLRQN